MKKEAKKEKTKVRILKKKREKVRTTLEEPQRPVAEAPRLKGHARRAVSGHGHG
jgi:hypothetical protein